METNEHGQADCRLELAHYSKIITTTPGKRRSKVCIRKLCLTFLDVLDSMTGGMGHEEILEDFPELTDQDLRACLAFAGEQRQDDAPEEVEFSLHLLGLWQGVVALPPPHEPPYGTDTTGPTAVPPPTLWASKIESPPTN